MVAPHVNAMSLMGILISMLSYNLMCGQCGCQLSILSSIRQRMQAEGLRLIVEEGRARGQKVLCFPRLVEVHKDILFRGIQCLMLPCSLQALLIDCLQHAVVLLR